MEGNGGEFACLPVCLPACLLACLPACLTVKFRVVGREGSLDRIP